MALSKRLRLPATGWRRAAVINSIIVGILATILTMISISAYAGTDRMLRTWTLFSGDCTTSTRINLFLHLVINVISTLTIASSNFFMQILNSPTRRDVDKAHAKNKWLEVGIPSFGNILHVSKYKTLAWVLFNLSSIPIHLVSNSAIFETDYSGELWTVTMASESFAQGAEYHSAGAGMVVAGASFCGQDQQDECLFGGPYGGLEDSNSEPVEAYDDPQSGVARSIADAAANGSTWANLSAEACRNEYHACKGRTNYGNLLMVLDDGGTVNGGRGRGWALDDIYNLSGVSTLGSLTPNNGSSPIDKYYVETWDALVGNMSHETQNSLWFSAPCFRRAELGEDLKNKEYVSPACETNCVGPLGLLGYGNVVSSSSVMDSSTKLPTGSDWTFGWANFSSHATGPEGASVYLHDKSSTIKVRYCLAEEKNPVCKVALFKSLLMVTTFCVIFKTILCSLVVTKLSGDPLVTPGDAIQSFIIQPDPTTRNRSAMTAQQVRDKGHKLYTAPSPGPQQWSKTWKHLGSTIPKRAWFRTYALFAIVLSIVAVLMVIALESESLTISGSSFFGHESNISRGGLITADWLVNFVASSSYGMVAAIVIANAPQIMLSLCYFAFNALFTRFQAETEWNSFSVDYRPLRVTSPQGEQHSTYRLQLPYRYSLPLLVTSIFLHWLTSNVLYLVIVEGGFYSHAGELSDTEGYGLTDDAAVGVGFSSGPLVLLFAISCFLISIPVAMARRRYRGPMVVASSNSRVISAACHVSTLGNAPSGAETPLVCEPCDPFSSSDDARDTEIRGFLQSYPPSTHISPEPQKEHLYKNVNVNAIEMSELDLRTRIAQGKLKWGEVRMVPEFYREFGEQQEALGHLSFGTHDVTEPVVGRWYA